MRQLILIHGRNVAGSVENLLTSLLPAYGQDRFTELLFIDDTSTDDTFQVAQTFQRDRGFQNLRLIRTSLPQGYGGNQKVGLRYALESGFDTVLVLNAAFPHAPGAMATLRQTLETTSADVVLGVAEKAYTPGWLSLLQNRLAGVRLKGWHSLYKGYKTKALAHVAFELNASDPSFETELLLQLLDQGCRIQTVPLPLPVGHPARQKQKISWGIRDLKASLKYRLQKYNLFYDFRYHPEMLVPPSATDRHLKPYDPKLDLQSPHSHVCHQEALVPPGSRVLDIGCSTGYVADYLTRTKQCQVVGIDLLPTSRVAEKNFAYHQVNIENDFARLREIIEQDAFDVILMLDVLEHLAFPELFLLNLRKVPFKKPPRIIFSTGNVAFVVIRMMLLFGYFNYGQKGILDVTHKRLFSFRTFKNLFDQTGFIILERIGFPLPYRALGFPRGLSRFLEICNVALIKIRRSMFAYQIMFVTTPLALPERILAESLMGRSAQEPSQKASGREL